MRDGFHFELGALVAIVVSNEQGKVIARAEYLSSANQYQVRYLSADGRAVESWWDEDALRRAGREPDKD